MSRPWEADPLVHFAKRLGRSAVQLGVTNDDPSCGTRTVGAAAVVFCLALFVCTGMIYACIKFIEEWAHPLTLVNYTLIGLASLPQERRM